MCDIGYLKFLKQKFRENEHNLKTSIYEIINQSPDILTESSITNFNKGLHLIDDIITDLSTYIDDNKSLSWKNKQALILLEKGFNKDQVTKILTVFKD